MKVSELIELLKQHDPNMKVVRANDDVTDTSNYFFTIKIVRVQELMTSNGDDLKEFDADEFQKAIQRKDMAKYNYHRETCLTLD